MQIHLNTAGQLFGPLSLEAVNQRLQEGSLPFHGTMAWHEGLQEWQPLAQISGVTPPAGAPPPPPPVASVMPPPIYVAPGDSGGGIIPTKNPPALIGYYLGVFGVLPVLGILLSIPALVLGLRGLKRYRENPMVRGKTHAWTAIILGGFSAAYHLLFITMAVIGAMKRS